MENAIELSTPSGAPLQHGHMTYLIAILVPKWPLASLTQYGVFGASGRNNEADNGVQLTLAAGIQCDAKC